MNHPQPSKNHLIRITVICLLLLVLALIPFDTLFGSGYSVCVHYHIFGVQCPFCGMTRAVHQFVHFRFVSALHYNAVVVLLPFYLTLDVAALFHNSDWLASLKKMTVIVIVVAFLCLYAFRMASYFNWI